MWSLGVSFFFYASFQRVAPSAMLEDLMRSFAATAVILGNLSAFFYWSYAFVQIPVGIVVDRWGPKRVLTTSALLCTIGALAFAVAATLPVAYASRMLLGIGTGLSLITTLRLAVNWFPAERYAMIAGLTVFIGSAGAIASQAPLAALIDVIGWRSAMIGSAIYAAFSGVLFCFAIQDAPESRSRGRDDRGGEPTSRFAGTGVTLLYGLKSVIKNPQSWFIIIYHSTLAMPLLAFAGLWGVVYLTQVYGISRTHAGAMTSLFLLTWGLSAPLGGWLSDRMGRRKPLLIGVAVLGLIVWCIILYVPNVPLSAYYVLLPLAGLGGAAMGITFALIREHNTPFAAGAGAGFLNTGPILCGGLAQPLSGWFLDLGWDGRMGDGVRIFSRDTYVDAFVIFPIAAIVALVFSVSLRETYCRQQIT